MNAESCLTASWQTTFTGVTFTIPFQSDVDDVVSKAKCLLLYRGILHIPKALPPPQGRPLKNAGVSQKD